MKIPFFGLNRQYVYLKDELLDAEDQTINKKIYYYHQLIAFLEENDKHESVVKYMNEVADLVYVATLSEEFLLWREWFY